MIPMDLIASFQRVLGLSLGFVFLAGCGNDPNPRPLRQARPDGSPWLVRYSGLTDEPRSLDPQVAYDQMSRRILEPVIETLLEYHPFKTDPYEVVPVLLSEMPERELQADGSVSYLCKLKPGIFYVDDPCFPGGKGRELVAADVHYAFQRICDPKVGCPVFGNLAEYIKGMSQLYEGAKKNGDQLDYSQKLSGLEVIDSHTFKLHLLKPYPQIIYWLAMHFTAPVAREAVEYYDGQPHPDGPGGRERVRPKFAWHPVATGPFVLHEYRPGHLIRLARNERYRTTVFPEGGWAPKKESLLRPFAGKNLPLVDEVLFTVFREELPTVLLSRQGYLDGMVVRKDAFNSFVTPSLNLDQKYARRGMSLEKDVELSTFYMSLNMQDPVLGPNPKLRQALSCARDTQAGIDIFRNGVPPVAQQLIAPGIFGFQPGFRNPYGFNLEKARQLMVEAGYPGGRDPKTGRPLELTMDVNATGAQERQVAEFNQRQFQQLGIQVKIVENTFARMLEKEDQGNFQIASGTGWGADYPDPENFFFLFYGRNFPPEGKNISRYRNPEFDRLFEQMATMENSPERLEIVRKMNAILAEDCPVILEMNKAFYVVVQPFAPRTQNNTLLEGGLKYAWIDHPLREQKRRDWNPVPLWPLGAGAVLMIGAVFYSVRWNRRLDV